MPEAKFTQHPGGPGFDPQYHQEENVTVVADLEPFVTPFSQHILEVSIFYKNVFYV